MGPSLSMLHESAIAPVRGTRPNDGRSPVQPQRVDGEEIEPNVSDPMLKATHPAAVAEAGPPGEPPEPRFVFPGFRAMSPEPTPPQASEPSEKFSTSTRPPSPQRISPHAHRSRPLLFERPA